MTASALGAVQTPDSQTLESRDANLTDWYLGVLISMREKLQRASRHVVADAYFSSNTAMSGKDVIEYYRTRFQIEFCFRDAEGFTGLMQSQARDVAKLSCNFNASLTTVNLAKVLARKRSIPFSTVSCKLMIHNAYLLDRFIRVSGIRPNRRLKDKLVKELIEFAAIAA